MRAVRSPFHLSFCKGSQIQHIQTASKTKILIPKTQDTDTHVDIEIEGSSEDDLEHAIRLIQLRLTAHRPAAPPARPTHFISIPLAVIDPNFAQQCREFLGEWQEDLQHAPGYHPSILVRPEKLHLTLGVMNLSDPAKLQEAADALISMEHALKETLGGEPLILELRGLSVMKGDVYRAEVVYAQVHQVDDSKDRLNALWQCVEDHMKGTGMSEGEGGHRIPHMTLANVKYRRDASAPRRGKIPFDASVLFQKYQDRVIGRVPVDRLHLSSMRDVGNDGFYGCCAELFL